MTARWVRHGLISLWPAGWGARLGMLWLLALVAVAALSPLAGYPVGADVQLSIAGQGPSAAHPLGTDHLGRDTLARLLLATRSFVGPGLIAATVAAVVAVPTGAVAGFVGGGVALAVRFAADVLASVPRFVLVLLLLTVWGDDPTVLGVALGLAYVPELAEALRTHVESLRHDDFVDAGRAHGVPDGALLWQHLVLGASMPTIGRHLARLFGFTVVVESTLAYLGGFGVQEPTPSWGNLLVFEWGRGLGVPQLAPAVALWLTIAASAVLASGLGDSDAR
jgi:peptide/nickel transport system permease protein